MAKVEGYTPPQGVHIAYTSPQISNSGVVSGAISYTAISANPDMNPAKEAAFWQFTGINLSGLEFGKTIDPFVVPNLSIEDENLAQSDLKDTQAFIDKGMNTVRIPLSWGYLQLDGAGEGQLNRAYYDNYVRPLIQSLTKARVHTIIDLHAYMRYSKFGEQYSGCGESGECPDGTLILDEKAYESVWGQLVNLMQNDPTIDKNYLLLDLMNEPVDIPDDKVFTIQTAIIKMLQNRALA